MEEIDVNMPEIPKRGSKITRYEGGRLPIRNIDGDRHAMVVSDRFNLPSLHEVIYERETITKFYISLFIYPIEGLMRPRGTEGNVWGCEAAVRG